MTILEIFFISLALSIDALAVSVCYAMSSYKLNLKKACLISLSFGGFQAIMPMASYFGSSYVYMYVKNYAPIIAFVILIIAGIHMIRESTKNTNCESNFSNLSFSLSMLLFLSLATSIDALAIGISFAFIENINIFLATSIIGITTFFVSFLGVILGGKFKIFSGNKANIFAGFTLIVIAIKFLFTSFVK